MSKIAEQKALEAYPILFSERNGYDNTFKDRRESYIKGYDQAMQDFLEKAERYLNYTLYSRVEIEVYGTLIPDIICKKGFIENFKNYMKKEA